jgi:hypothetical protein
VLCCSDLPSAATLYTLCWLACSPSVPEAALGFALPAADAAAASLPLLGAGAGLPDAAAEPGDPAAAAAAGRVSTVFWRLLGDSVGTSSGAAGAEDASRARFRRSGDDALAAGAAAGFGAAQTQMHEN